MILRQIPTVASNLLDAQQGLVIGDDQLVKDHIAEIKFTTSQKEK